MRMNGERPLSFQRRMASGSSGFGRPVVIHDRVRGRQTQSHAASLSFQALGNMPSARIPCARWDVAAFESSFAGKGVVVFAAITR